MCTNMLLSNKGVIMDISLSNNLENLLKSKVTEGIFGSMDEAVTFAVQFTFLDNNITSENIKKLNEEIEKGWQDMEAGKCRNSQEVFSDLRKRYA